MAASSSHFVRGRMGESQVSSMMPVLHLAGASRRNDTGRKLDTIDLSGQRYVNAYDRPISVLTQRAFKLQLNHQM